ncbi:MAG TPA: hypothetical protein VJV79_28245 [Polyangiaceae bacterium]|nr:hypothetical protein [Polyangiaceae bacterium]
MPRFSGVQAHGVADCYGYQRLAAQLGYQCSATGDLLFDGRHAVSPLQRGSAAERPASWRVSALGARGEIESSALPPLNQRKTC